MTFYAHLVQNPPCMNSAVNTTGESIWPVLTNRELLHCDDCENNSSITIKTMLVIFFDEVISIKVNMIFYFITIQNNLRRKISYITSISITNYSLLLSHAIHPSLDKMLDSLAQ